MSEAERHWFIRKLMPEEMADEFAARFDGDNDRPRLEIVASGGTELPVVGRSVVNVGGVQLPVYEATEQVSGHQVLPLLALVLTSILYLYLYLYLHFMQRATSIHCEIKIKKR
jgi:hypothetical protein